MLTAIIEGLCQCGPFIPRLKDWIPAIVTGLEARKNYNVLIEVSEKVIGRLLKSLAMPLFRPLTYPVFKQFLYPVTTPHVFLSVCFQSFSTNFQKVTIYVNLHVLFYFIIR